VNWLRNRLRRWLGLTAHGEVPPLDAGFVNVPDWSEAHAGQLRIFLASETGQVWLQRMKALGIILMRQGVKDVFHTAHSAGVAAGFEQAVAKILADSTFKAVAPEGEPVTIFAGGSAATNPEKAAGSEQGDPDFSERWRP